MDEPKFNIGEKVLIKYYNIEATVLEYEMNVDFYIYLIKYNHNDGIAYFFEEHLINIQDEL